MRIWGYGGFAWSLKMDYFVWMKRIDGEIDKIMKAPKKPFKKRNRKKKEHNANTVGAFAIDRLYFRNISLRGDLSITAKYVWLTLVSDAQFADSNLASRGQVLTSQRRIAELSNISKGSVNHILQGLEKHCLITKDSTKKRTLITINDYDRNTRIGNMPLKKIENPNTDYTHNTLGKRPKTVLDLNKIAQISNIPFGQKPDLSTLNEIEQNFLAYMGGVTAFGNTDASKINQRAFSWKSCQSFTFQILPIPV